jgi:hypothetical protein
MNGVPSLLNVDDAYFFRERFPEANAPGMVGDYFRRGDF